MTNPDSNPSGSGDIFEHTQTIGLLPFVGLVTQGPPIPSEWHFSSLTPDTMSVQFGNDPTVDKRVFGRMLLINALMLEANHSVGEPGISFYAPRGLRHTWLNITLSPPLDPRAVELPPQPLDIDPSGTTDFSAHYSSLLWLATVTIQHSPPSLDVTRFFDDQTGLES